MIKVLVFGLTLRDAVGESELELDMPAPTTVRKMVEAHEAQLGALISFIQNREVLITVNKKISAEDTAVKDGDLVKFSFQSGTSYDGTRDIPT